MTRVCIYSTFPEITDPLLRVVVSAISFSFLVAVAAAAAAIILRVRHTRRERRQKDLEAEWVSGIISLVVAPEDTDYSSELASVLLDRMKGLPPKKQRILLELLVRFAFIVTGSARRRLDHLARPALPAVRELLLRRDPALRALGVHIIGLLGFDDNQDVVLKALDDSEPIVCMTAARALARTGRTDFVMPILSTAGRLNLWGISEVVSVIRDIGPGAVPQLRDVFADSDQSTEVRVICAEALRWLNDFGAAQPAAQNLRRETDRELLASSLRLLGRVGEIEHAPAVRHLCTSHDPVVRMNAITALSVMAKDADGGDAELIGTAIADPSEWVALRAARGLRSLQRPEYLRLALAVGHHRADLAREVWPGLEQSAMEAAE